jgi:hypothetical protein
MVIDAVYVKHGTHTDRLIGKLHWKVARRFGKIVPIFGKV